MREDIIIVTYLDDNGVTRVDYGITAETRRAVPLPKDSFFAGWSGSKYSPVHGAWIIPGDPTAWR